MRHSKRETSAFGAVPPPDPSVTTSATLLRSALDESLRQYQQQADRDGEALLRYIEGIRRRLGEPNGAALTAVARARLLGEYVEAGFRARRRAGKQPALHPSGQPVRPLLQYLWDQINLECGKPLGVGRIPAKEIVARAVAWQLPDLTPDQVRKQLKR